MVPLFKFTCVDCSDAEEFMGEIAQEFGEGTDLYNLHKRYLARYGLPEVGRHRATYLANNYVIKLPVHPNGFADNDWEGSLLSDINKDIARTRLVLYGPKGFEIPIVLMERVKPLDTEAEIEAYGERARETAWNTDCMQVGLSKRGNVVAYDYGMR